jgi:AraC-like DNA-binding protein
MSLLDPGLTSYRELLPHPLLRPFVDRFWISSAEAGAPARRILPDGCIDVLVDLARGGRALAVGTMTRASVFDPRAPVRIAAVRFRPGGAVPFLRVPAEELTDRTLPCAEIGARWLAHPSWSEPIAPAAAVDSLQGLLLDRLAARDRREPVVAHAVTALLSREPPSIEALSRDLGWSRQHLARSFRFHVGVSPKQLARVARLQRAVAHLQGGAVRGLADLALGLGYFDQAHMARDFHALAAVTPIEARASTGSIFPIRSLFADP